MSKRSNPTNKAAGRPGLFTAAVAAHFHTATVSLNTFQLFCFSNWLQMKLMYIPESRGAMTRRWIKISNFSFYCWRRTLTIERCYGLGTQVSWILHNVRPSMCVPKQTTQNRTVTTNKTNCLLHKWENPTYTVDCWNLLPMAMLLTLIWLIFKII